MYVDMARKISGLPGVRCMMKTLIGEMEDRIDLLLMIVVKKRRILVVLVTLARQVECCFFVGTARPWPTYYAQLPDVC